MKVIQNFRLLPAVMAVLSTAVWAIDETTASSAPMPDVAAAVTQLVSRTLVFRPVDASGAAVTVERVAQAVAVDFPFASRYGRLREGDPSYASMTVSAAGTQNHGLLSVRLLGVRAKANRDMVKVEYLNGKRDSGQSELLSSTSIVLKISAVDGAAGSFQISPGPIEEREVRDLLIFKQKQIDTRPNIEADMGTVLSTFKPRIEVIARQELEFESAFAPVSTFANFERLLGKASNPLHVITGGDLREGQFRLKDAPEVTNGVYVKVFPYRAGAKVLATYSLRYFLNADGSDTFDAKRVRALEDQLRKVAAD